MPARPATRTGPSPAARFALRNLTDAADARVEDCRRELADAQTVQQVLAEACETGDLDPLLPHLESLGPAAAQLSEQLTTDQVRTLLAGGHGPTATRVVSRWVTQQKAKAGGFRARCRIVLLTPGWPPLTRIQLLVDLSPGKSYGNLVDLALWDPGIGVFVGMHLTGVNLARLRQGVTASRLAAFEKDPWVRLGVAFPGGMRDGALEVDLIGLITAIEHPEVAATLAEAMPPLVGTYRDIDVARRLERLMHMVDGVMAEPVSVADAS